MRLGALVVGPNPFSGPITELNLAESFWDDGFLPEAGSIACIGETRETVNSVPTRHCQISEATFNQLASLFGGANAEVEQIESLSFDVWLHETEGWPVRVHAQVSGTDETGQEFEVKITLDVTDVSEDIEIVPPSGAIGPP